MICEYQWPQAAGEFGGVTYPNLPSSLPRMLETLAMRAPNHVAVIVSKEQFTYQDLWERSGRAALYLHKLGIGSGDRVVLRLSNAWSFVVWLFGCMRAGCLVVPTNYRFSNAEFLPVSTLLDPTVTICERSDHYLTHWTGRLVDEHAYLTVDSSLADIEIAPEAPAVLFLTSGTSGAPKAVPLSHENMLTSVETYRRVFSLGPSDSTLITVPLFHVTGLIGQLLTILAVGGTAVLTKRFVEAPFLDLMKKHRVTFFFGVPTIFIRVLNHMRTEGVVDLPDWRVAASGGAPIPAAMVGDLKNTFPRLQVFNTYGMTEVSSPAAILPWEDALRRPGSVGHPVPFAQLRVVDPGSEIDVNPGEVGELWIRGPMVSKGYWNKSERNLHLTNAGWIMSGDLAWVDDEGFLYIVDRLKDVVNRGGEKVFPGEVENILFQHPNVLEASVVGVPDEVWGENIAALVVPRLNCTVDPTEIREWVSKHLSRYKVPKFVVVGTDIPKNQNGKVDKKLVKTLVIAAIDDNQIYVSEERR